MPTERTPLIQVVQVVQRPPRYPHSTLRRFCTLAFSCILIIAVICLVGSAFLPKLSPSWLESGISFDDLTNILLSTPDEEHTRKWSQYYTSGPHLAGKNLSQALWTREKWQEWGIKSEVVAYDVYINYPVDHRLALLKNDKVIYECSLEEDVLPSDPTTNLSSRIPTFHGYSASGNVTAPYVFVNFATHQDFEDLLAANISLSGKIALAKYGRIFRGLKVKRAQELGMLGVVLYSDLDEDGNITEQNGHLPYPQGPARNPSSVQRGSVQYLSPLMEP